MTPLLLIAMLGSVTLVLSEATSKKALRGAHPFRPSGPRCEESAARRAQRGVLQAVSRLLRKRG